jgi:hypothetical protein
MIYLSKIIAFSLGFVFLMKPIFPFIDYHLNYKQIVSELCEQKDEEVNKCNGTCHLIKNIKKFNDETPTSNPSEKKQEKLEILFLESFPVKQWKNFELETQNTNFCYYFFVHQNPLIKIPYPPPMA